MSKVISDDSFKFDARGNQSVQVRHNKVVAFVAHQYNCERIDGMVEFIKGNKDLMFESIYPPPEKPSFRAYHPFGMMEPRRYI